MRFHHTVVTVAAPADVWAVWTDVVRWPTWDTELESASIEADGLALGAGGTLKPRRGPASAFIVTEFEDDRGYAFATRLPWGKLVVRRRLNEHCGGGTAFTHEVSFVGPLSFLFGVLLGRRFRAALPGVMENVRRIAESRYRGTLPSRPGGEDERRCA